MSITKTTHDKVCGTSTEAEESQLQIYNSLFKNMRYTIEYVGSGVVMLR